MSYRTRSMQRRNKKLAKKLPPWMEIRGTSNGQPVVGVVKDRRVRLVYILRIATPAFFGALKQSTWKQRWSLLRHPLRGFLFVWRFVVRLEDQQQEN